MLTAPQRCWSQLCSGINQLSVSSGTSKTSYQISFESSDNCIQSSMCQHSGEVRGYGSSVASFVAVHAKLRLAACWEDCPFVSLRCPSSFTLEYFWHFFLLAEEHRETSNRGVPCRKKGRPKKKKDGKNKEGKPVKTKKRKKIVSILISPVVLFHL